MKHFLRKISADGMFVEDMFWDDGQRDAVPGIPLMTTAIQAAPAIPATEHSEAVPAVEAVPSVQMTGPGGELLWEVAPITAIPASAQPADLISTAVPGGFRWPKWNGTAWVEGNTAPAPVPVPQTVTRRQAKQALRIRGLVDSVPAAIAAIPDPLQRGLMQDEWLESQVFERHRPSLIMMAHAIGLTTDAQIDDLFVFAATL